MVSKPYLMSDSNIPARLSATLVERHNFDKIEVKSRL